MSDSKYSNEVSLNATDSPSKVLTREALERVEVASWKIKAYPHPIAIIDKTFIALMLIPFALYGFGADSTDPNDEGLMQDYGLYGACWIIFFWTIARKRTVFNYTFTEDGGHVEYWQNYASFTPYIFKGIAITAFVAILTMIAIQPSAIWMLAGPALMAISASSKLMTFENPVDQHTTMWSEHDLVLIDRKRKMIVATYQNDTMAGFEIHVKKRKIDKVVTLLKTLMPDAEFREEEWKWFY